MTLRTSLGKSFTFAAMLFALSLATTAHAQLSWLIRNQRTGGDDLWGVASGSAGLVAVGTNGAILQSTDGQTWTRRTSGTTDWLTAIAYGSGRYVAVGDRGRILTSTDGTTWTTVAQNATTARLNNVALTGNQFTAVGEAGTILVSPDGLSWSASFSGTTKWLRGIAYGQAANTPGILTSTIVTGQAGTLLVLHGGVWNPADAGTSEDLEAAVFVASNGSHPVAGAGGGQITFGATGTNGAIRMLDVSLTAASSTIKPGITPTAVTLDTTRRIRCLVSGAHYSFSAQSGGSLSTTEQAPPVVLIDEVGKVFAGYDYAPTTITMSDPGVWRSDSIASADWHAGVYHAPQESFYVVGQNETIIQRDQVFNGRAGNISTRGFAAGGGNALFAGFVVRGVTMKSLLVRAAGPSLASFGVTGALADPVLTVFDATGKVIATNTRWGTAPDAADISAAAIRAGAFPFASGSNDSAAVLRLAPGVYTAQIAAASGIGGVALAEVYDLDVRMNGFARATNLATRGLIAGENNPLVAGLVVQGPAWRTFLIRGVGPGLAKFGVTNALADPVLGRPVATSSSAQIVTVPGGTDPNVLRAAAVSVGAFALDAGSADAAALWTLSPGNYTVQLSSQSKATGVALLEIYEVGLAP